LTGIVIDASITAAWCFEEDQTEAARQLLGRSQEFIFNAPLIWPLEMTNVLLVNERRRRITAADTVRFVGLLKELAIQVDRPSAMHPFDSTLALARQYSLSAYDAAYLELAIRKGISLATLDRALRNAASAAGIATAF